MDETSILEGQGSNGLVVGSTGAQNLRKKQPGSRAWTTILECVSATGFAVPPLVIYKGRSVQQQCFPLDLRPYTDWQFHATDETAIYWLKNSKT